MDRMVYTAMNGANQIMLRQTTNNHNLANLDTTGFRADIDIFSSLPVYGPGYPTRVYTEDQRAGIDLSQGKIYYTGNNFDIAVTGDGFIAVAAPDGREAYTRAGSLKVTSSGQLQNSEGHSILGNGGPVIIPPFEKIEIAADGTISILPLGQSAASLAVVDRVKLVRTDQAGVVKGHDGLLRAKNGTDLPPDASVRIASGSLESSNVNSVGALIDMIQLSRSFENQTKLIKISEEMDAASAKLLGLG